MSVIKKPNNLNHTLITINEVEILRLKERAYQMTMKNAKFSDNQMIEDLLKNVPGFNEIDISKTRNLIDSNLIEPVEFNSSQIVVKWMQKSNLGEIIVPDEENR